MMGSGEVQSLGLAQSSEPGTQASDTHRVTLTHHHPQEVLSQAVLTDQLRS